MPNAVKYVMFWFLSCLLSGTWCEAQRLQFEAEPAHSKIYLINHGGPKMLLGQGSAQYKLSKEHSNTILVEAEGFLPRTQSFPKGARYRDKVIRMQLEDRVVVVSALPFDADILLDGVHEGQRRAEIVVGKGQAVTVQVKRAGFRTQERLYRNQNGHRLPPATEEIRLDRRVVVLNAQPSGAEIAVDDEVVGTDYAEVEVAEGLCVHVEVTKEPFVSVDKTYCHQERRPVPPETEEVVLRDWALLLQGPDSAEIEVNELEALHIGEYPLIVPHGACRNVEVSLTGYISNRRKLCNQPGQVVPSRIQVLELRKDEAFDRSEQTDQANVDFVVEVHPDKTYDEAWKLLSQIVLDAFDVLEITDRETGYLRTAWEVDRFEGSTVRTRIIIKQRDYSPIKFAVKIVSEHATDSKVSAKEDAAFREWDHLMYEYKDILTELGHRLGSGPGF